MKRVLPIVIVILVACAITRAVTFTWLSNPETNIASYVIYMGTNTGRYLASTNCGNVTNFAIASSALFPGTNFVALTAVDALGFESAPTEISFVLPSAPKNFRVKLSMDSATSPIGPWTESVSLTNSFAVQDTAYFRGRLDIQPSSGVP